MTTPDELQRAVKALTDMRDAARDGTPVTDPNEWEFDELTRILAAFHFLLSEQAELLATVERQGEALKLAREIFSDMIRYGKLFSGEGPTPYGSYYIGEGALETLMRDEPRAALTTGEEK